MQKWIWMWHYSFKYHIGYLYCHNQGVFVASESCSVWQETGRTSPFLSGKPPSPYQLRGRRTHLKVSFPFGVKLLLLQQLLMCHSNNKGLWDCVITFPVNGNVIHFPITQEEQVWPVLDWMEDSLWLLVFCRLQENFICVPGHQPNTQLLLKYETDAVYAFYVKYYLFIVTFNYIFQIV